MRYEDSMKKVADDILKEQQDATKFLEKECKWHDEYATLNFFRYVCKRIGNLREGEIKVLVCELKQTDVHAVAKHRTGEIWAFDYDRMYEALQKNMICRKVCEKNRYRNWSDLIQRYCVADNVDCGRNPCCPEY